MADNLLNSSISALATKIATDVASASIDELVDLARAAQSIGEDDNTTIETAINTRVNALYSSATPEEIKKLAVVVDKMTKLATVGSAITDISQLTDNTSLLSSGGPDLSAVGQHILPTTDDTYDLGSSSKKFRDVYLGASTLYLGDKQISSDAAGIVLPAGSKIGTASIPTDVSDLTDNTSLLGSGDATAVVTKSSQSAMLAISSPSIGDMVYRSDNAKLMMYNGSGWYVMATINTTPILSSVSQTTNSATSTISSNGTFTMTAGQNTVVTITGTDAEEGTTLNYSATVISGTQANVLSSLTSSGNVFTLTPATSVGGTITIRFDVSDSAAVANQSASFTLSFAPAFEFLVVGGGGGGGGWTGAGGGAGGYRTSTQDISPSTVITVTIGAGGAGGGYPGNYSRGSNGGNSSITGSGITDIVSTGGGGGGGYTTNSQATGNSGGSGGGGGHKNGVSGGSASPSGQGNAGGASSSSSYNMGGGGGSGAVGNDGNTHQSGGEGGIGTANDITGTSVYYAGGGSGAIQDPRSGTGHNPAPLGGGGNGKAYSSTNGSAGTANTGGGGGGARDAAAYYGGSGVVIMRMLTSVYSGTSTGSPTVTTDGSYTVVKFTASGSYTV